MALFSGGLSGCTDPGVPSAPDAVWGRRGISDGRLQKPRAMVIDRRANGDEVYIVDITGRIQVFDVEGNFRRGWNVPAISVGKPTGLSFDRRGRLMVADSHYFRVLFYDRLGNLLPQATIEPVGGKSPDDFGFVGDVVEDAAGSYYAAIYGGVDRLQKFSPDGELLLQWGSPGVQPGQFRRPNGLAIDVERNLLYIADAGNHRVQVLDISKPQPELVAAWGEQGQQPGQLKYPYDLALDGRDHIYIVEFGNHRVQKFTTEGGSLAVWGKSGRASGQLFNPWAVDLDSLGRVYVLDTYNHRVQRVDLRGIGE